MGHSLGEFSALVAADVMSFENAIKTVVSSHLNQARPQTKLID
jgi:malonyl CoA-acyl carrier protein transacylase